MLLLTACPTPQTGVPCEVAELVATKCSSCHGATLMAGAPQQLLTLEDLTAVSPLGGTYATRSLARMKDTASPMPPGYAPQPTAAELAAFERWVLGGTPAGACAVDADAGLGFDAGPPPLTCATGRFAARPTVMAPLGGDDMAPGFACSRCHRGLDFEGQNPGGLLGMTPPFDIGGTVYASLYEQDLCISSVADAGIVVEIFAEDGGLTLSAPVGPAGNFYVPRMSGLPQPYSARVRRGNATRAMATLQTDGDCNVCHTERGREGAPGRIVAP
ncbi:MAG: hypothetical protein JNK82_12675 [Myxococcaceae bacterium]|nr:hypothetical protein [Myxococcaceae bacterium]